ncbi:MAG: hypothetical protein OXU64_09110 [Gemmatimonadota bacterium]|nr:hypothetical protein [Gemmatimonadota bacterium]
MRIDFSSLALPPETIERLREQGAMLLLRFFSKAEYADEFMAGRIRFGHLLGYRDTGEAREDANEGARVEVGDFQNAVLWVGGIQLLPLSADQGRGTLTSKLTYPESEFLYVCSFAGLRESSCAPTVDVAHLVKENKKFGGKCVIIPDGLTFFQRLVEAAKDEDRLFAGPVEYHDPTASTATEQRLWDKKPHLRYAFRKTRDYQPEQEYRIVLERKPPRKKEMYLHVPPLSDIAYVKDIGI